MCFLWLCEERLINATKKRVLHLWIVIDSFVSVKIKIMYFYVGNMKQGKRPSEPEVRTSEWQISSFESKKSWSRGLYGGGVVSHVTRMRCTWHVRYLCLFCPQANYLSVNNKLKLSDVLCFDFWGIGIHKNLGFHVCFFFFFFPSRILLEQGLQDVTCHPNNNKAGE